MNFRKIKTILSWRPDFKKIFKFFVALLIYILIFTIVVPFNMLRVLDRYYNNLIYSSVEKIPETRVAVVFGAGLSNQGTEPSPILADRINSAIELYKAGKVKKILMSGDNRFPNYNEPQVMMDYAVKNGVSLFDLQADFAGRRTYDTCYRAKYIFGLEKAILITQDFHLTRALYTCNALGIEAIGYKADKNEYLDITRFTLRDLLATLLAYWEIYVSPPQDVVLGDPITF